MGVESFGSTDFSPFMLHELMLGLDVETVERVRVNTEWFDAISD